MTLKELSAAVDIMQSCTSLCSPEDDPWLALNDKDVRRLLEIKLTDGSLLYTTVYYIYRVKYYCMVNKEEGNEEELSDSSYPFYTCDILGKNPMYTFFSVSSIMYIRELPIFIDKKDIIEDL